MPNFNRANLSLEPLNVAINDALERAAATKAELPWPYLGASIGRRENDRRRSRLGDVICRLASTSDGEMVATVLALQRLREAHGVGFRALIEHLENGGGDSLSDTAKEKVRTEIEQAFNDGYAQGVQAAESKQHGTVAFRKTDGTLEWSDVALFVQRPKHRLPAQHHEFVDDMASRTLYGREPTPKQHQYLHSLFYKLGGKLTS